jgi:AraC family transcriptional regulator of adaptative response/methylated-DNA-[protein]-cysteine methyltransferase
MKELTFEEKYSEIKRDSKYNWVFFTCVTSTGIFCKPTCKAKKPMAKNVIFCDTVEDAIKNWFRPCKMCKPMENDWETPDFIKNIIKELQENPYLKIKDSDLKARNIEPSKMRRWFKQNHNMTFQAYQRMLKINKAYNQIKWWNSITKSAFWIWYDSLSSFNESWKNIFWKAPKNTDKNIINITRFTTKSWPMFACANENWICLLEFTDKKDLDKDFKNLCNKFDAIILPWKNKFLDKIELEYKN